jgi:hypothetical protein
MADGSVDAVFVGCFGSLTAPPRERVVSCSLRPRESLANRLDSGFSRFESGVQTPFWHPRRSFPMAPRCPSWPPLPPVYVCFYSFAMYRGPESRLVFRAFASRRGRSSPGSRRCPREITEHIGGAAAPYQGQVTNRRLATTLQRTSRCGAHRSVRSSVETAWTTSKATLLLGHQSPSFVHAWLVFLSSRVRLDRQ